MRYAENLAGGHGFVWNPGGPTVEGFSNPLLVGVEALGAAAGLPPIDVARGLGIGCGIALLALIHVEGTAVLGRTAARAGMLLTALFPPFVLWAVGGSSRCPRRSRRRRGRWRSSTHPCGAATPRALPSPSRSFRGCGRRGS